eukprot:snap_masked-scaffold_5-processed-gene-14.40-mRNA-1 protein AED:1.00 eAED:1.00 QI:0/0/0/0/1/1/2/0/710
MHREVFPAYSLICEAPSIPSTAPWPFFFLKKVHDSHRDPTSTEIKSFQQAVLSLGDKLTLPKESDFGMTLLHYAIIFDLPKFTFLLTEQKLGLLEKEFVYGVENLGVRYAFSMGASFISLNRRKKHQNKISPLVLSTMLNKYEIFKIIFYRLKQIRGPKKPLFAKPDKAFLALEYALINKNKRMAKMLLQTDIKEVWNKMEHSRVLSLAKWKEPYFSMVKLLFRQGMSFKIREKDTEYNIFHFCVKEKNIKMLKFVQNLLFPADARGTLIQSEYYTLIHSDSPKAIDPILLTLNDENTSFFESFLDLGYDIDMVLRNGFTLLEQIVTCGKVKHVSVLLNRGARIRPAQPGNNQRSILSLYNPKQYVSWCQNSRTKISQRAQMLSELIKGFSKQNLTPTIKPSVQEALVYFLSLYIYDTPSLMSTSKIKRKLSGVTKTDFDILIEHGASFSTPVQVSDFRFLIFPSFINTKCFIEQEWTVGEVGLFLAWLSDVSKMSNTRRPPYRRFVLKSSAHYISLCKFFAQNAYFTGAKLLNTTFSPALAIFLAPEAQTVLEMLNLQGMSQTFSFRNCFTMKQHYLVVSIGRQTCLFCNRADNVLLCCKVCRLQLCDGCSRSVLQRNKYSFEDMMDISGQINLNHNTAAEILRHKKLFYNLRNGCFLTQNSNVSTEHIKTRTGLLMDLGLSKEFLEKADSQIVAGEVNDFLSSLLDSN